MILFYVVQHERPHTPPPSHERLVIVVIKFVERLTAGAARFPAGGIGHAVACSSASGCWGSRGSRGRGQLDPRGGLQRRRGRGKARQGGRDRGLGKGIGYGPSPPVWLQRPGHQP